MNTTCHHCENPATVIATGKLHNHRLPKNGIALCEAHSAGATKTRPVPSSGNPSTFLVSAY